MTLFAFILILVSVFLHAGWNFLSKKMEPSVAFFMIAAFAGSACCAVFLPFCHVSLLSLPGKFWLFVLISNLFEVLYFYGLARGYRSGELSLVYPMGRALPVLFVAAVTLLFHIGKTPSLIALGGMVLIFCGCLLMPLQKFGDFHLKNYYSKVMLFILLIASGTTGYTVFDSFSMKILSGVPFPSDLFRSIYFSFWMELLLGLSLLGMMAPNKTEWTALRKIVKSPTPYLAGVFSVAAYALVLIAMNHVTNVSFLQAFRQMSLPVGVLFGVILLKESCSIPKRIGICLIVAGLIITVI